MYIPELSNNMEAVSFPQIRLLLQGEPGTGKTYSALTAPNILDLDLDNGLTAHAGRKDVIQVPVFSDVWCEKFCDAQGLQIRSQNPGSINRRDIIKYWLDREGRKLEAGQTLIVDSWTTLQEAFDRQTRLEPVYTKTRGIDEYAFWDRKMDYSEELCNMFCELQCHVIVTTHEYNERDKITGKIMTKYQPLMQGKFITKFKKYFTDCFRCVVADKLDSGGNPIVTTLHDGSKRIESEYFWQTKGNDLFDAKRRLNTIPDLIPNPQFNVVFKDYGMKE